VLQNAAISVMMLPEGLMNQAPTRMRQDSAAERCREFEGVPQILPFDFPQEWGAKGVDYSHVTDVRDNG
jgi:hypothetical protein